MRELERELGVDLLERTTREVRLTAAGRVLLEEGKHALEVTDAAFARTREVGTGLAGTIRIGYSPAIGPIDQTDVAHVLRAHGPDLSVELLEVRPAVLRPMPRAGELDLALTRIAGAVDPALHSANLRPTPLMLCVPQDHRLAGRTSVVVTELEGERLLMASPPGTPYTDLLLERLAREGVSVATAEARVTGGAALPGQLVSHDAVAVVPVGTPTPHDVVAVGLDTVTVPLLLLWSAGLPSPACARPWAISPVDTHSSPRASSRRPPRPHGHDVDAQLVDQACVEQLLDQVGPPTTCTTSSGSRRLRRNIGTPSS